jgi:hypothetical protein
VTPLSKAGRVLAALSIAVLLLAPASQVAAKESDRTKGIPANPSKKKIKGIPANAKPALPEGELTEEEKKMVEEIANRTAVAPTARHKVELPPQALAARPPVVPQTRAPRPPSLPMGDPNTLLVHIPQVPKRITPPVTMVEAPAADPTKKKKN